MKGSRFLIAHGSFLPFMYHNHRGLERPTGSPRWVQRPQIRVSVRVLRLNAS